MTSENDFVASEIRKSGYPLEVEVAEVLEESGWEVLPAIFYEDEDDGQYKEIDLLAYRQAAGALKGSTNYPYSVTIGLILECKKRENFALVFFPRQRKLTDLDFGWSGLAGMDSFLAAKLSNIAASAKAMGLGPLPPSLDYGLEPRAIVPVPIANQLQAVHQFAEFGPHNFRCLSVAEKSLSFDIAKLPNPTGTFDRNEERRTFLNSLNCLAKATRDRLEKTAGMLQTLLEQALNESLVQQQPHLRQFSLYYFFPVLIFGGKLKVWKKGSVTDVQEVLFQTSLESSRYREHRLINVITADHLKDWLESLLADSMGFVSKLVAQKSMLDAQVELLLKNKLGPSK